MAERKKLTLLVEALTSCGDFVNLFDEKVDESVARRKMAAALKDVRALELCDDEGSIIVSLQNEEAFDDDGPDAIEFEYVQFAAEDAVQALHKHFDWDRTALRQALAVKRVARLVEEHKNQRIPASDQRHKAQYELMAQLNMLEIYDKRNIH